MIIKENEILSEHTTIALGGAAKYFIICEKKEDIKKALIFSAEKDLPVQVISGGSNVIFSDEGFNGAVLKVDIKGISEEVVKNTVIVKSGAGERLDDLILYCSDRGYVGIECLSGIPGSVGATPVQNVGAYGQEISGILEYVNVIDRSDLTEKTFGNSECRFSYRQSRFKNTDIDRYIITEVVLKLSGNILPEVNYPALNERLNLIPEYIDSTETKMKVGIIRDTVISIRQEKSMVIDKNDINSRSCGSFFMNPVLSENEFIEFKKLCENNFTEFPYYENENKFKIPAAWLVEKSGFPKGYKKDGAGISSNHSLALININGTSSALLELSEEIKSAVYSKFRINLIPEPVIIQYS